MRLSINPHWEKSVTKCCLSHWITLKWENNEVKVNCGTTEFTAALVEISLRIFYCFYTERTFCCRRTASSPLRQKVVPWCKVLTSRVSRQRRIERCRKQSSACFCSTSSDMAWPLHRSPPPHNGLPSVCVCISVCKCVSSFLTAYFALTNLPTTLQDKSPRCFLGWLILVFIKCCWASK